jgi:hypothetical protein
MIPSITPIIDTTVFQEVDKWESQNLKVFFFFSIRTHTLHKQYAPGSFIQYINRKRGEKTDKVAERTALFIELARWSIKSARAQSYAI